jgi:hypothetical protein
VRDLWAGLVATTGSGLLLLVAGILGGEHLWFLSQSKHTVGTVVAIETTRPGSGRAVVEFATSKGGRHQIRSSASRPPLYRVGERVDVDYLPGAPAEARLQAFTEHWLVPLILGGVGLLLLPLGLVALVPALRRRRLEQLRSSGLRTVGTVVESKPYWAAEWGKTVHTLTIRATDPTTGQARQFTSHRVPAQGQEWVGRQLGVLVDPSDARRYLVDAPRP